MNQTCKTCRWWVKRELALGECTSPTIAIPPGEYCGPTECQPAQLPLLTGSAFGCIHHEHKPLPIEPARTE